MSLDTIAIVLFFLALAFNAAVIYVGRQRAKRRDVKREARELEYAIERDKPNPLRVIGGSRGPAEDHLGHKKLGL